MRAIKIIDKAYQSKEEQEKLINEVQILRTIDHPNIIKVFEFYQEPQRFYIVTELCQGGELFDYILDQGHLTEAKAAVIMQKITSALMYCHQHNIMHRDLKPENLLLEREPSKQQDIQVKVIDFGTSVMFKEDRKIKGKFGTAYYIAPEVLTNRYNEKCDIWSAGVILYILLCGYPPFNGNDDDEIIENVKKGEFSLKGSEWEQISPEAKDLVQKMIVMDPTKRLSA